MSMQRWVGSWLLFPLFSAAAVAAPVTQPAPPARLAEQVAALIKQLDSESYQDREAAIEVGSHLPIAALPLLKAAAAKPEISADVRACLESIIEPMQVTANKQSRYQSYLAYGRKREADEYERVNLKSPKWDALMVELMEAEAHVYADWLSNNENEANLSPLIARIIAAGCTDPLLKYRQIWYSPGPHDPAGLVAVCDAVQASNHSPKNKFNVLIWMASNFIPPPGSTPKFTPLQYWQQAVDLYPEVLKTEPGLPTDAAIHEIGWLTEAAARLGLPRQSSWQRIDASLAKAVPEESLIRLAVKGDFLIDYAYDGFARDALGHFTNVGRELFDQRLADAEKTLSRCYELYPDDWHAPQLMIRVTIAQGAPRPRMEMWFGRAMKINPGCYPACEAKLWFLEPRLHGSKEEELAFGRQCLDGGEFDSNVPLTVVNAHLDLAPPPPWGSLTPNPYYAQNDVWADIKAAYDGYIPQHPDAWRVRSDYARFAWLAGKWQESADLHKQLADAPEKLRGEMYRLRTMELAVRLSEPPRQDPSLREAADRKRRLAEITRITTAEYDRVGRRDARWDADVHAALAAFCTNTADGPDRNFSEADTQLDASARALAAGCDDPLVRWMHSLSQDEFVSARDDAYRCRSLADATALRKSGYCATLRALALAWSATYRLRGEKKHADDSYKSDVRAACLAAEPLLTTAAKEQLVEGALVRFTACTVYACEAELGDDAMPVYRRMNDALTNAGLDEQSLAEFKAQCMYDSARALYPDPTRKRPYAQITKEELAPFQDRMKEAQSLFEALWQKNPNDQFAPRQLMTIAPSMHPNKEWLDFWFRQALAVSPGDLRGPQTYYDCLLMCTGSYDLLADFGQTCADTADYRNQIPFIEVQYEERAARFVGAGKPLADEPANDTIAKPAVWSKIAGVYESYLAKYPLDSDRRSEYASYACRAGRWQVAQEQFTLLGSHVRPKAFGSKKRLDACRKHLEDLAADGDLPTTQPAD